MGTHDKMNLRLLKTGVPGLDEVLGGGLPEYSFNLLAGPPGAGKTTLAHQIVFANATEERPALYFTVLGEPGLKMLRYQQQLGFFDPAKVGRVIRFVDLSEEVLHGDMSTLLEAIVEQVRAANPRIVVVDSFRTVLRSRSSAGSSEVEMQSFLQRLAMYLASWEVTSFLVGEYGEPEMYENPVFTIADGTLWLSVVRHRNAMIRKIQALKIRGMAAITGLHTFRISDSGIDVFPRTTWRTTARATPPSSDRLSTGVPRLDEIMGGGILRGDITLATGPTGTGKTVLGNHFILAGAKAGEPAVLALFEEHADEYLDRARGLGLGLDDMISQGMLKVLHLQPLDLSADEILRKIEAALQEVGARRLVIDSLNGLELSLSGDQRDEFRDALYRTIGRLSEGGTTILLTMEVPQSFTQIPFTPHGLSFLTQNILFLRYVELEGRMAKLMAVMKMRRSAHSRELFGYEITSSGFEVGEPMRDYQGVLTGVARRKAGVASGFPGLTSTEQRVLQRLGTHDEASAEVLADELGLGSTEVADALRRLVSLNYALDRGEDAVQQFRVLVRTLGE